MRRCLDIRFGILLSRMSCLFEYFAGHSAALAIEIEETSHFGDRCAGL